MFQLRLTTSLFTTVYHFHCCRISVFSRLPILIYYLYHFHCCRTIVTVFNTLLVLLLTVYNFNCCRMRNFVIYLSIFDISIYVGLTIYVTTKGHFCNFHKTPFPGSLVIFPKSSTEIK